MPDQETDQESGFDGEFDEARAKALIDKLRGENKALKGQVNSTEAFYQLKAAHPFIVKDDLEGLPQEKWEARVARLAELRGPAAPGTAEASTEAAAQTITHPEEAAFAAAQTLGSGAPTTLPKMTREEARALGGPANPTVYAALKEGRVEGVSIPT